MYIDREHITVKKTYTGMSISMIFLRVRANLGGMCMGTYAQVCVCVHVHTQIHPLFVCLHHCVSPQNIPRRFLSFERGEKQLYDNVFVSLRRVLVDVCALFPALSRLENVEAAKRVDDVRIVDARLTVSPNRKSDSVRRRVVQLDVENGGFWIDGDNHTRDTGRRTDLKIDSQLVVPHEQRVGGVAEHTHYHVVVHECRVPLVTVENEPSRRRIHAADTEPVVGHLGPSQGGPLKETRLASATGRGDGRERVAGA